MIIGKNGRNTKQLRREIGKSFMQRYGVPVDVLIQVGNMKMGNGGSITSNQILNFKGNRKLVNENAVGLKNMHERVQASSLKRARTGIEHKNEIEKEMMKELREQGVF